MRWLALSLALALPACKKGRIESVGDLPPAPPPTVLDCPEGSLDFGGRPPHATEFWCAVSDASGRWYRNGPAWTFHTSGLRSSFGYYQLDQRVGHWWYWDESGGLLKEGEFSDDRETGWWIIYNADGTVQSEGPMHDGGRHGTWVAYDPATATVNEGGWQFGEKNGVWVEYDAEGTPLRERVYRAGRLISQREIVE